LHKSYVDIALEGEINPEEEKSNKKDLANCQLNHEARFPVASGSQPEIAPIFSPWEGESERGCYTCIPAARLALSMVLRSSMAIVIGPTPPGTGVIAAATSLTSSKATSPTSL
jgi:hypothetical protein